VSCPIAELPVQNPTSRFLSPAWWWRGGEGGVGRAGWGGRGGEGGSAMFERKIRLFKSECNVNGAAAENVALATSIVKSGEATALHIRNT
jgi:hypothetical protein